MWYSCQVSCASSHAHKSASTSALLLGKGCRLDLTAAGQLKKAIINNFNYCQKDFIQGVVKTYRKFCLVGIIQHTAVL